MAFWTMRTVNARSCGARAECSKQGTLRASFSDQNQLVRLELVFDVLAFMRSLQKARDSPFLELVPNTLEAAQRMLSYDDARRGPAGAPRASVARVISLAARPYIIARVNQAFSQLCGYDPHEIVGRSLRLIQGPATDIDVVEHLLADVARRLPASMIVVNYHRDGSKFVNYLRVYPLSSDARSVRQLEEANGADGACAQSASSDSSEELHTHYMGELERLDDDLLDQLDDEIDVDVDSARRASPDATDGDVLSPESSRVQPARVSAGASPHVDDMKARTDEDDRAGSDSSSSASGKPSSLSSKPPPSQIPNRGR